MKANKSLITLLSVITAVVAVICIIMLYHEQLAKIALTIKNCACAAKTKIKPCRPSEYDDFADVDEIVV